MAHIIVLGGGVCGLATGLRLRRDGHEVTVLERDAAPVPDTPEEAWERWERDGVVQFRQTHYLIPHGWAALGEALPDVAAALESAGGARLDMIGIMPPTIADRSPRPGDERLLARLHDAPSAGEDPRLPGPDRRQLLALPADSAGGVAQEGEAATQGA